ncbi:hypothetical protein PVAG01_08873 [Phlyctema vagabunda]|uniref:Zinc-binding loop region of homing endonuclease domain-containing protein n=1 Tax=Phlyctema vagabunda TaxID=108571 RepID=A0ABR4PAR1_9HELO
MACFFFGNHKSLAPNTALFGLSDPPSTKDPTTTVFGENIFIESIGFKSGDYTIGVYPGTFRTYIDLTREKANEESLQPVPGSVDSRETKPASLPSDSLSASSDILAQDASITSPSIPYGQSGEEIRSVANSCTQKSEAGNVEGHDVVFPHQNNEPPTPVRRSEEIEPKAVLESFIPEFGLPHTPIHQTQNCEKDQLNEFETQDSGPNSSSSESLSALKSPHNRLSCEERKRIIVTVSRRPEKVTQAMQDWVSMTNNLLDPFRSDEDCWFHPSPPSAFRSSAGVLRPYGKIQKRFSWQDDAKHSLVINYGIVSRLVSQDMTNQQKDGFVNRQWHLSHLCGNWTCLNPKHSTIEPGEVNISRNVCFSHRSGCPHHPPCLKDKKVALGPDGKPMVLLRTGIIADGHAEDGDDCQIESFDEDDIELNAEAQVSHPRSPLPASPDTSL